MDKFILIRLAQILVQNIIIPAALLFLVAGRLDWPAAWAYFGIYVVIIGINMLVMMAYNKELIAERAQLKEGGKRWDKIILLFIGLFSGCMLLVAGLDFRYGWSPALPMSVVIASAIVMAAGYLFFTWAMASNKFFSAFVRIQKV